MLYRTTDREAAEAFCRTLVEVHGYVRDKETSSRTNLAPKTFRSSSYLTGPTRIFSISYASSEEVEHPAWKRTVARCQAPGCRRKAVAQGACHKHYEAHRRQDPCYRDAKAEHSRAYRQRQKGEK